MRREPWVDYFSVRPEHEAIDARLQSWARWVRVRPHGWQTAPMFRQYRSHAWQWHERVPRTPVNVLEAVEMEKAVSALPDKHRAAIRFCYVWCGSPGAFARVLGVSKAGLLQLIEEGRQMLVNRGNA